MQQEIDSWRWFILYSFIIAACVTNSLSLQNNDVTSLQYISHYNIAEQIPLSGSRSFDDLSRATGLDYIQLRRILRHAMLNSIFRESSPGNVAHTAASALLVRDQSLRAYVGHVTEVSFPVSAHLTEAVDKWGASPEKNETAYNVANGTDLPMFAHLSQDGAKVGRFAQMMGAMTKDEGYGDTSIAIARAASNLKFIVQDQQDVIATATVPEGLESQITFMAHDFFTEQPIKGADVYFMRQILHDYSDKYAAKILENLMPALKDGTRIVLMDGVMPEPGILPKTVERHIR